MQRSTTHTFHDNEQKINLRHSFDNAAYMYIEQNQVMSWLVNVHVFMERYFKVPRIIIKIHSG